MHQHMFERTIAAIWFAIAACVHTFGLLMTGSDGWPIDRLLIGLLPIMASAISGYFIGWSILDTTKIVSVIQVVKRGFVVTLVSYVLLGISFSVNFSLLDALAEKSHTQLIQHIFVSTFLTLIVAPFVLWWLVLLMIAVGGSAGALLYIGRDVLKVRPTPSAAR